MYYTCLVVTYIRASKSCIICVTQLKQLNQVKLFRSIPFRESFWAALLVTRLSYLVIIIIVIIVRSNDTNDIYTD